MFQWRAYADRLMLGESLDMAEGLPADFKDGWLVLGPVPKGKRCMAVTFPPSRVGKKGKSEVATVDVPFNATLVIWLKWNIDSPSREYDPSLACFGKADWTSLRASTPCRLCSRLHLLRRYRDALGIGRAALEEPEYGRDRSRIQVRGVTLTDPGLRCYYFLS